MALNPPFRVGPFRGIITGAGVLNEGPCPVLDDGSEGALWAIGSKLVAATALGISVAAAASVFTQDEQIAYPPPLGAEASPGTSPERVDQKLSIVQWDVTDELPLQVTGFTEDEFWTQPYSIKPSVVVTLLTDTDDAAPQEQPLGLDTPPGTFAQTAQQQSRLVQWDFTDELPTTTVVTLEEDYWQVLSPCLTRVVPGLLLFAPDELTQTPAVIAEESEWQPQVTVLSKVISTLFSDTDELPYLGVGEDYQWSYPSQLSRLNTTLWSTDDECPQPATQFVLDEDYQWNSSSVSSRVAPTVFLDTDEIPSSSTVVDEVYWWVYQPVSIRTTAPLFSTEDEITTPAAPIIDEVYWWTGLTSLQPKAVVSLATSNEDIVPAVQGQKADPSGIFSQRTDQKPSFVQWEFSDELPVPITPLTVCEDYWVCPPWRPAPLAVTLWQVEDEVPQYASSGYEGWQLVTVGNDPYRGPFMADELFVPPATPLTVDEVYVWVYTPEIPKPTVTLWKVEDEKPTLATPLGLEEDYWQTFPHAGAIIIATVWNVEDERPTPAVAFGLDEEYWQYTPRLVSSVVYQIWNAEDERPPVLDETEWQAPIVATYIKSTVWTTEDDLPVASVVVPIEEDALWPNRLQVVAPVVTLWNTEDEVSTPVAPASIDEVYYWQNPTVGSSSYHGLFIGDDDLPQQRPVNEEYRLDAFVGVTLKSNPLSSILLLWSGFDDIRVTSTTSPPAGPKNIDHKQDRTRTTSDSARVRTIFDSARIRRIRRS